MLPVFRRRVVELHHSRFLLPPISLSTHLSPSSWSLRAVLLRLDSLDSKGERAHTVHKNTRRVAGFSAHGDWVGMHVPVLFLFNIMEAFY